MAADHKLKPPQELEHRTIRVQPGQTNTVEVPSNKRDRDFQRWFLDSPIMQPIRHGNQVDVLIDGQQTFSTMVEEINATDGADNYVYLLGWSCRVDFDLDRLSPGTSLIEIGRAHV